MFLGESVFQMYGCGHQMIVSTPQSTDTRRFFAIDQGKPVSVIVVDRERQIELLNSDKCFYCKLSESMQIENDQSTKLAARDDQIAKSQAFYLSRIHKRYGF